MPSRTPRVFTASPAAALKESFAYLGTCCRRGYASGQPSPVYWFCHFDIQIGRGRLVGSLVESITSIESIARCGSNPPPATNAIIRLRAIGHLQRRSKTVQ